MSEVGLTAWLGWQAEDLLLGSWEARHSLFAHFALYGAVLAGLGIAMAPLGARAREWGIAALSVAALALFGSVTMALWALGFSIALWFVVDHVPGRAGTALAWLLVLALGAYPWLLPQTILTGNTSQMREFWAFASNVWLLRCAAYIVDRRARAVAPRTLREFLLATLFFPTFVNGPIETTEQMADARRAGPAVRNWAEFRDWLHLLAGNSLRFGLGIAKVLFATLYLGIDNATIFATSGSAASHPRLWLWPIELYFMFYVTFSGWTDVSVALGRVLGWEVMENFDRPWQARSVAEFWRRWHISFGVWLRNYIYIPLGGNRRNATLNVLATFLVSGLWHVWGALKAIGITGYPPEAWTGFILWGLLNGSAIAAARYWNDAPLFEPFHARLRRSLPALLRLRAAQLMTFVFVALAWMPFFLPPWIGIENCWHILRRMVFLA
jgi:D-alanyl-lipoteichoic acid acyltransferase DltB (MBOAT superfamily)